MIVKAQKRPVTITACRYTGENLPEILDFVGSEAFFYSQPKESLEIYDKTTGHWQPVPKGFYIIKGIKGEHYPCSVDVFDETYKVVEL